MKIAYYLAIPAAIALSPVAIAADSNVRTYPQDTNPACMDRAKDASSAECTPQTDGEPRHYVQPVKPVAPPPVKPVTPPPPPTERPAAKK